MNDKYTRVDNIQSVYCYQETNVYINNFNIQSEERLKDIESDLTQNRLLELAKTPIKGKLDKSYLIRLHRYIFQDIYPFAGEIRVEDIWKQSTFFCRSQFIINELDRIFEQLKNEKFLKTYGDDEFVSRLTYYMSEINIIHPFREGNGRVIREFIRVLALKTDRLVNWHLVDSDKLLCGIIDAVDFKYQVLESCLRQVLGMLDDDDDIND